MSLTTSRLIMAIAALSSVGCGLPKAPVNLETDLSAGMTPEEVEKVLGSPSERGKLTNHDPPVSYLKYHTLGLTLRFSPEERGSLLYSFEIESRLSDPVFGIRVYDGQEDLETSGFWVSDAKPLQTYKIWKLKLDDDPRQCWRAYSDSTKNGTRQEVTSITFFDEAIYGKWEYLY